LHITVQFAQLFNYHHLYPSYTGLELI